MPDVDPLFLASWLGVLFVLLGAVNYAVEIHRKLTSEMSRKGHDTDAVSRGECERNRSGMADGFRTDLDALEAEVDERFDRLNNKLDALHKTIRADIEALVLKADLRDSGLTKRVNDIAESLAGIRERFDLVLDHPEILKSPRRQS